MKKLKTLTEAWMHTFEEGFISLSKDGEWICDRFNKIVAFGETDLTLADLVPCKSVINIDDNYNKCIPLEKPMDIDEYQRVNHPMTDVLDKYAEYTKEYQQALDRVVFEGWSYDCFEDSGHYIEHNDGSLIFITDCGFCELNEYRHIETRQDLEGFELTQKAYDELYK